MKTLTLTVLLLTAACSSNVDTTPANNSNTIANVDDDTNPTGLAQCAWVDPNASFHTFTWLTHHDFRPPQTWDANATTNLMWEADGILGDNNTPFKLLMQVDPNNNQSWLSLQVQGEQPNDQMCPPSINADGWAVAGSYQHGAFTATTWSLSTPDEKTVFTGTQLNK